MENPLKERSLSDLLRHEAEGEHPHNVKILMIRAALRVDQLEQTIEEIRKGRDYIVGQLKSLVERYGR